MRRLMLFYFCVLMAAGCMSPSGRRAGLGISSLTNTNFTASAAFVTVTPSNNVINGPTNLAAFKLANDIASASTALSSTGGAINGAFGIATTDMVFRASTSEYFIWPLNESINAASSFFTNLQSGLDPSSADEIFLYDQFADTYKVYYLDSSVTQWVALAGSTIATNIPIYPGQVFAVARHATNDFHAPVRGYIQGSYVTEQWMSGMFLAQFYALDRRLGGRMGGPIDMGGNTVSNGIFNGTFYGTIDPASLVAGIQVASTNWVRIVNAPTNKLAAGAVGYRAHQYVTGTNYIYDWFANAGGTGTNGWLRNGTFNWVP